MAIILILNLNVRLNRLYTNPWLGCVIKHEFEVWINLYTYRKLFLTLRATTQKVFKLQRRVEPKINNGVILNIWI